MARLLWGKADHEWIYLTLERRREMIRASQEDKPDQPEGSAMAPRSNSAMIGRWSLSPVSKKS